MHKTLFAIAAIIGCSGYFIQALSSAYALPVGPTVSSVSQPWRSFTGEVNSGYIDLIDVPEGQVFIVTTFVSHEYVNLFEDTTLKYEGHTRAGLSSSGYDKALAIGNGHMVFEAGHTVRIRNVHSSGGYDYYIEGYFAQA